MGGYGEAEAEDLSASSTLVHFDRPLPLLRVPLLAGASDDPSAGPFVLAFRDADSWRAAFRSTEARVVEQCEAGARVGCSLSASKKCSPPWWKTLLASAALTLLRGRSAKSGPCSRFAREKCLPAFRDARISSVGPTGFPQLGSENPKLEPIDQTNYRGSALLEEIFTEIVSSRS
ncbi:unnamed protein product [Spirodela intermedia]|uniref:Uncharacterized protein n=1 Tax=Spirodela intermedia TaxID=51605 RepID=A0A7I8IMM4_SPIIN|nr:unnamed protein product [Spirodela intermedia]CAA6658709.1 unnamed protein product [Spirodela intermedia]